MQLTRWRPWTPSLWNQVQEFQNEMNRLFSRWTPDDWRQSLSPGMPAVNVWEDVEHVFVEAELPGMEAKDLEIHVTGGNQLTLKGERKVALPDKAVFHRQERGSGEFVRALTLPFAVNADHVEAKFENGVLLIKLAKKEEAKARKIAVKCV